jgi:effector-binding domain-containing protein
MSYTVEMKNVPATPLLVVRRRARAAELSKIVPDGCGIVWKHVRASGILTAGRHVAVYRACDDGRLDVEVGVEVGADAVPNDEIALSATPAGEVATATHVGSYAGLGAANAAIKQWCDANHRQLAGPSWEVYGHMSPTDGPENARTDVFWLLKPAT